MRNYLVILVLCAAFGLVPAVAWAGKCTRVLPQEVFDFFGDQREPSVCGDYEYKLLDLNDDGKFELHVTNYRRSCEDIGFCNVEFFKQDGEKWLHIATIPGRIRLLKTTTGGYHDIATWLLGQRYVYIWDGKTYKDSMQGNDSPPDKENDAETPDPGKKTVTPTP
ncbi:MAG: hypothetical protein P9L99_06470 [Candidatus Lernaella stagnicola]|nr:hypothetical protein [Candidatus Lernaella stagnicola]